jgi:hypothetical protein
MSPDFTEALQTSFLQALLAVPVLAGCLYYTAQARELRLRGGCVDMLHFGLPDLFMGSVLAAHFGWTGWLSLQHPDSTSEMGVQSLRNNLTFMLLVLAVILGFALMRRIPLGQAFHLARGTLATSPLRAAIALGLALPPIYAAGFFWEQVLHSPAREQSLVSLFRTSAETGDLSVVRLVILSAVVQAPLVEEILFRGYFYITLKRYAGTTWAALTVSALFALCHGNIGVLPGLFILSLCQIIALERFGSLWVCIGMHTCFNALSLLLLYMEARGWLPH